MRLDVGLRRGLGLLLACALAPAAAAPPAQLAWLREGELRVLQRQGDGAEPASPALRTPLGSLWKLFVHAYLVGRGLQEPPYRCQAAQRLPDEAYCCDPGESVGRDDALARSCGPYFEPRRLALSAQDWRRFWQDGGAPAWLLPLEALRPGTEVPVAELLRALRQVGAPARVAARQALLPLAWRDDAVLGALGSGVRYKTWSWSVDGRRAGGAAGWLADGTPFWFGAGGTSRSALQAHVGWIAGQWAAQGLDATALDAAVVEAQPCIDVRFFQRYPVRSVRREDGSEAGAGALRGPLRIEFRNGQRLAVEAVPALVLHRGPDGPEITARLPLEDYVARVIDREGSAAQTAAARALAVAARSYVLQNAQEDDGCRRIADDSRAQRVSPNPPSAAARAAAAFTEGLVLGGAPVRYHSTQAAPGVLSWQAAVDAGRGGAGFEAILRAAYPGAVLGGVQAQAECEPLPQAAAWLAQRQSRWRSVLREQPGWEPVAGEVKVCRLALGSPHSDQRRLVIRVREWASREGRVTLIHEYLHLAFRHHPRGRDEAFIETLAQRLADT